MPRGVPTIGSSFGRATTSSAEELTHAPAPKVLGSITLDEKERTPSFGEDGPPPWETDPRWGRDNTDARRFIECPETWELRWLNPRLIDQAGFRDWRAIPADHERVTLKVPAMHAPDNTIRRGSHHGDLLCFMPKSWMDSRRKIKAMRAQRATQSSVDRQEQVKEEMRRGHFGRNVSPGESKHPGDNLVDGRTIRD